MIFRSAFEYYPSGISTILCHCTTSYEFLLVRYFSSILPFHRFWVVANQEHRIPFSSPFPCVMSSLLDGILLKPLDKLCRNPHQHLGFFQVLIEFMVWNTILAPRWFVLSSTTSLDSLQLQLGHVYLALLSLGKDIHVILVYHYIFLSIGLFDFSFDVTYLSSDNSLLM